MSKIYIINTRKRVVIEREVVKETDHFLTYRNLNSKTHERFKKGSNYAPIFERTEEKAYQCLYNLLHREYDRALSQLNSAKARLDSFCLSDKYKKYISG